MKDCRQSMVTPGSLHTTWMTVCAAWVVGHVTEMAQFGAAVEVLMSTQNVQKLTKNDLEETTLGFPKNNFSQNNI